MWSSIVLLPRIASASTASSPLVQHGSELAHHEDADREILRRQGVEQSGRRSRVIARGLAQEVDDERGVEVDHRSAAVAGLSLRARICASMASRVSSEILSLAATCLSPAAAARRSKCDLITSEKLWPGSFWRASAS